MDFRNKVILAPMVRVSTHPFRLLSLEYGADLVFVEEIVDCKLYESTRIINEKLNTVDYLGPEGNIVFRTSPEERDKVILQLGTSDQNRALKAAKHVENDVAGIDVNMGCPKDYSVKGGMGSALLKQPDKIKAILETLVDGLKIPVTCKIRVLPSLEDTLELVKMIEKTGVKAITVHGRTKTCRTSHPCKVDYIKEIKRVVNIPIIANGGSKEYIKLHDDIEYFRQLTGSDSVMVAREAMWNPCVFMTTEKFEKYQSSRAPEAYDLACARDYLRICLKYDHHESGAKYCLLRMMLNYSETDFYENVTRANGIKEICHFMEVDFIDHGYESSKGDISPVTKRLKLDCDEEDLKELLSDSVKNVHYIEDASLKSKYDSVQDYPKQVLYFYCKEKRNKIPIYRTKFSQKRKLFYGSCEYLDSIFVSQTGYRQKRFAEQSAALACLRTLKIDEQGK